MANLTQRLVDRLKPQTKPYEVADQNLKGFLLRVQPSGSKSYYYRYRGAADKKSRICLGSSAVLTVAQARQQAQTFAGEVATGQDPQRKQQLAREQQRKELLSTLSAFLEQEYTPWFLVHRKGGADALREIERTFAFLLPVPMKEITPLMIERWRTKKHMEGTSKCSLNRYLSALRSCLNKAVEWDFIEKNPVQKISPYKTDRNKFVERYLSANEEMNLRFALDEREQKLREERERYNQWLSERDYPLYPDLNSCAFADYLKPLVLLAMNTGMRRGELLTLCWQHVSFEHRLLSVRGENAKSGQTRHIPLNDEALSVLQRWHYQKTDSDLVFPNHQGNAMTDIKKSWAAVLKRANIKNFRFHDLRHHFASQLVMAGVDLNTVRQLLGHRDYSSTLRYAHLAPQYLAEAVARIKPRQWQECKAAVAMR